MELEQRAQDYQQLLLLPHGPVSLTTKDRFMALPCPWACFRLGIF